MKKCIHCGTELPEGAKFCFKCGGKQLEQETKEEKDNFQTPAQEEEGEETTVFIEEASQEASDEETAQEPAEEDLEEAPDEKAPHEEEQPEAEEKQRNTGRKFCPYCGAQNDADAVFCFSCGKNMTAMGEKNAGKNGKSRRKFGF